MAEQTRDQHETPDRPTNISGGRTTDDAPGAEQRSFQTRPGDEEAVQHLHPEDRVPAAALQIGGDVEGSEGGDPNPAAETPQQDRGAEGETMQTYAPSNVESTRTRMQGGGVGQQDMDQQRDPTRSVEPTHVIAAEENMSNDPDPSRTDRGQDLPRTDGTGANEGG